jgi:ribosomal protein S27AE
MGVSTEHPEGLFCPKCGCGSIIYWPEIVNWSKWNDAMKATYETCANCGYNINEEDH